MAFFVKMGYVILQFMGKRYVAVSFVGLVNVTVQVVAVKVM